MKLGKQCFIKNNDYYHRDGWPIKSVYGTITYWYSRDGCGYHREGGPAIEDDTYPATNRWFLNKKEYPNEQAYKEALAIYLSTKAKQDVSDANIASKFR